MCTQYTYMYVIESEKRDHFVLWLNFHTKMELCSYKLELWYNKSHIIPLHLLAPPRGVATHILPALQIWLFYTSFRQLTVRDGILALTFNTRYVEGLYYSVYKPSEKPRGSCGLGVVTAWNMAKITFSTKWSLVSDPIVMWTRTCMYMYTCILVSKPIIVGTSSDRVVTEVLLCWFFCAKVFQRVRPEEITHWTKGWGLLETIQLQWVWECVCVCVRMCVCACVCTFTCTCM